MPLAARGLGPTIGKGNGNVNEKALAELGPVKCVECGQVVPQVAKSRASHPRQVCWPPEGSPRESRCFYARKTRVDKESKNRIKARRGK